ncbi:UDP-glucose 6-dehydrogenase [candidate division KSB1 bacterium]|nr:UDP-glucose 6-dehydrogenase [candidate division KSB1 bacterium]RQW02664.1 MAG: UDP-glucose 6-dehydrogenase [candidate division KSB1 bacterium]
MSPIPKKILCIGAGYVGGPTMAVIAAQCPQYKVTVVDINAARIKAWQTDDLPIYEPGLSDVVKKARDRNLFFSTDIEGNIKEADIIFVSVNTPTKTFGEGAGKSADLQYWEKTARDILKTSESDKIIVEKSTLPVRTAAALERILHPNDKGIHFDIVSNPEFLAEGTAINDLLNPDRVLIGSRESARGKKARQEIVDIYTNWVPRDRIVTSNIWSSELSKLVANAFLAQRISSINSISALCEQTEANITEVSYAIGRDSRIGARFLNASVGFGGSCFKKDILNLVYIAESYGLYEVAEYWEQVVKMNEYQERRFVRSMLKALFNTVAGKKIALFGFAFKANTGDTRESPAIFITRRLFEEKANIVISDPQALDNARMDLDDIVDRISFEADPYKAAEGAHAIAILTEWSDYKSLDYQRLYNSMHKPAFLFDGRNIIDRDNLFKIGFNVYSIGNPPRTHFEEP